MAANIPKERVYLLHFLLKSTHHSWRYERKCEWVLFSEHSVHLTIIECESGPDATNNLF